MIGAMNELPVAQNACLRRAAVTQCRSLEAPKGERLAGANPQLSTAFSTVSVEATERSAREVRVA
jgi:hypothetical protein